ncbi:MAG: hypothetical protein KKB31_02675 [Nanoarchaeota archaeon]|nr:hypothetical protein [Nanoarchaeota archaeon]
MFDVKVEKGSGKWFGITILLLSVLLVLSSLGKVSWIQWIAVVFSIILGFFLWREGGVRDYLRSKGYKKVTGNDLIVWLSFIFGTFLILNGIFLINIIRNSAPGWLTSFISTSGVIGGVVSGLLAIFLIFTPKPKA